MVDSRTWLIAEFGSRQTCFYLWEGPYNEGIVEQYKRDVRDNGGRVVAVIRPKSNAAT